MNHEDWLAQTRQLNRQVAALEPAVALILLVLIFTGYVLYRRSAESKVAK